MPRRIRREHEGVLSMKNEITPSVDELPSIRT
jgi:hypothetical protein